MRNGRRYRLKFSEVEMIKKLRGHDEFHTRMDIAERIFNGFEEPVGTPMEKCEQRCVQWAKILTL